MRAKPEPSETDGWRAHREEQILAIAETTPSQRLAWLEEAIDFVVAAGAIPHPSAKRDRKA